MQRSLNRTMLRRMSAAHVMRGLIFLLGIANICFAVLVCFDHPLWLWLCAPLLIAWLWWLTDLYFRLVRGESGDGPG